MDKSNEKALTGGSLGRWNYTISADAEISLARCPLCFRAYSDYGEPAVVPCYRCREEENLSDIPHGLAPVTIRSSVTVDPNDPRVKVLERYMELVIYQDLKDDLVKSIADEKDLQKRLNILIYQLDRASKILEIDLKNISIHNISEIRAVKNAYKKCYLTPIKNLKESKDWITDKINVINEQLTNRAYGIESRRILDAYENV